MLIFYVNNYGASSGVGSGNGTTVSVVDLIHDKIVGPPITVGLAPASLAITPDRRYVYVANYVDGEPNTGTITKVRTRDNTVVATIGSFKEGFSGMFYIVIHPNGRKAYVTNFGSNNFEPFGTTVSVVDLFTQTIEANVKLGIQPS